MTRCPGERSRLAEAALAVSLALVGLGVAVLLLLRQIDRATSLGVIR